MKRNFMHYYQAALKHQPQPRALFRLGAFHAGRGLSPTKLFDIGNLASELANSQGSHSLHILVIAAGGQVNRWFPFIPSRGSEAFGLQRQSRIGGNGRTAVFTSRLDRNLDPVSDGQTAQCGGKD